MKTDFRDVFGKKRLIIDGGTGTLLQAAGLEAGEKPEVWNISRPGEVAAVHRAYLAAGADIICTNTFGANSLKYTDKGEYSLGNVITAAVTVADAERRAAGDGRFVALDIGPLGKLLRPYGDLDFEEAVGIFAETVRCGAQTGLVDLIYFETFTDSYEAKAAMLAAKESCDLPVLFSCAYDMTGHLMTGADTAAMTALLEGLGADGVGLNCGVGVGDDLLETVGELIARASVPVSVKPNAGLPKNVNGRTVFDVGPEEFAVCMAEAARLGASVLGGCCGTTPSHIAAVVKATRGIPYFPPKKKNITTVSSYSHTVDIGKRPVLIGERINPTGKKALKEALRSNDTAYVLGLASSQADAGADILDVNTGIPGVDEPTLLCSTVREIQSVIDLPLQIDTSDAAAMEAALRVYNGKPLINSVNGKAESLAAVLPLAKKYGGVVVCLTLDENGIPETARGRADIAGKIISEAEKYGIERKNLIVDTLTLTVATDNEAAKTTLEAVRLIRGLYGVSTCLGVSNVSFGLPERDRINSSFFTLALGAGLDAAIMNPMSEPMMSAYVDFLALSGLDRGCKRYISSAAESTRSDDVKKDGKDKVSLYSAVVSGLKSRAAECAALALKTKKPLEIIDGELVPALTKVGDGFAAKTVFLPQLLMSAEAAAAAFEVIRASLPANEGGKKGKIILATVHGDIHDIGKNIVRALLENYDYEVVDLGRDVPPETVVRSVRETGARLVGLSALMTTTVPAMAETIRQLKCAGLNVKVMVGGAVLTQDYADEIGADHYSADAMDSVRYAEEIFG